MTHPTPDEHQPRIPGVKYRPVTRYRWETTTINGIPEDREVEYTVDEPVPPRDWDALVVRGVISFTVVAVVLAACATTASVGGLLDKTMPAVFAYGGGVLFTGAWLICLGVEWLERRDPKRAMPARVAGWGALVIAMLAVIAFGDSKHEPLAGAAGACLDLLAKGACALVIRYHATPLSEPVAFWLRRRREKLAAESAVAADIQRLDRFAAYNHAVYGPTAVTAAAVTTAAEPSRPLPAADASGQTPAVSAPLPAPVVTVQQQPSPAAAPAPVAPAPVVPAPVSAPAAVPAVAVAQQPNPAVAPASTLQPTPEPEATPAVQEPPKAEEPAAVEEPEPVAATLRTVGDPPGIAATMRAVLQKTPDISDADLVTEVRAVVGDRPNLADTIARTRRRKPKKKAAS
ncbi:hypothetical protein [[Kitasatospora] papulosa]|uniref:hypothetical protein n=1 Tax=[Kitasatospora] papulosa TaxID=1464011 RepID=UPI0036C6F9B1